MIDIKYKKTIICKMQSALQRKESKLTNFKFVTKYKIKEFINKFNKLNYIHIPYKSVHNVHNKQNTYSSTLYMHTYR